MLANDIKFEEELFAPGDAWSAEKKRMMETGDNPCGTVPVTILSRDEDDGTSPQSLSQHIAVCRYLARLHKLDTGDAYKDYVQDLVADEYQRFRVEWVDKTFSSTEEEKTEYSKEALPKHLSKFEALYEKFKTSDIYLSTSPAGNPLLWGDAAVFGLVRDHILTGHMTEEDLASSYTNLMALHKDYGAIPAVAAWIEEKEKVAAEN